MRAHTRVALVGAAVWSVGLLVGAVTLPVYAGSSAATDGEPTGATTSATLVEVNGPGVLVVVAIPLVASLAVASLLVVRSRVSAGRLPWLVAAAWLAVAGCGALGVLGLPSIGLFVLPVAVALAVAVATSAPPPPTRTVAP